MPTPELTDTLVVKDEWGIGVHITVEDLMTTVDLNVIDIILTDDNGEVLTDDNGKVLLGE